jgi:hypothetical protein
MVIRLRCRFSLLINTSYTRDTKLEGITHIITIADHNYKDTMKINIIYKMNQHIFNVDEYRFFLLLLLMYKNYIYMVNWSMSDIYISKRDNHVTTQIKTYVELA